MTTDALARLESERTTIETRLAGVLEDANEQGRDLTDDEKVKVRTWRERLEQITDQASVIGDALEVAASARERLSLIPKRTSPTAVLEPVQYRSAGHVLYDMLREKSDDAAADRLRRLYRAAEHMGTDKTNTVATAGDLGGIRVDPVVGPIIWPIPDDLPFLSVLGMRESNAISFVRPYIVGDSLTGHAGPQGMGGSDEGKEKAELPSKAFELDAQTVSLKAVGEYLNVSLQLTEFQPGALDIIIEHLTRATAFALETQAITELAKSTGKVTLANDADAAAIQKALWDASAKVWQATGRTGAWIAMGPLGAARLGSLVDAAQRPLFPNLGAVNALGYGDAGSLTLSTVAGMRPVITPAITDATFWVGNAYSLEAWVRWFPVLEALEPSLLGRQVARAAAFAAIRPTATANSAIHLAP